MTLNVLNFPTTNVSFGLKIETDRFIDKYGRKITIVLFMDLIRKTLLTLITEIGSQSVYNHLKFKNRALFDFVYSHRADLPDAARFIERAYCCIYSITKRPQCLECDKPVNRFYGFDKGYALFCSSKCLSINKHVTQSKEKTSLKKYNSKHPSSSKIVKDKVKETIGRKYNARNIAEIRWKKDFRSP